MLKKIGIFFSVIFVIYTIAWFVVANIAEKQIHSTIKDLEKEGSIRNYSGNTHISGYPFKFAVEFEYPNVTLDFKDHGGEYNFLYDGTLKIVLGFFSDSIKLHADGTSHLKGHVKDYSFYLVTSGEDSNYKIKLNSFLLSPSLIKNITDKSKSPLDLVFDTLASATIKLGNFKVINKTTNNLVANVESGYLFVSTTKDDGKYYVNYKETDKNVEFTQESVRIWQNFAKIPALKNILSSLPENVSDYFSVFSLDKLGVINYDAKVKVGFADQYLYVDIDKFSLKDRLENISLKGEIRHTSESVNVNISSKTNFSQEWYGLAQVYVNKADFDSSSFSLFGSANKNSIVSQIFKPVGKFFNSTIFSGAFKKDKGFWVPKLHDFGQISLDSNLNYKGEKNNDFALNIKDLSLSTNSYSFNLSGELENKNNKDSYKFNLKSKEYDKFVNIAVGYANRVIKGSNYNILFGDQAFEINEKTSNNIKSLLRKISNHPESADSNIDVTMKKASDQKYPSAGKYSSEEFGVLWGRFVASFIADKIEQVVSNFANQIKNGNDTVKDTGAKVSDAVNSILKNVFS